MSTHWCIDNHDLEVVTRGGLVEISINQNPISQLDKRLLSHYTIPWRGKNVELRRVRNLDVGKSELWIDGVCCPPNSEHSKPVDQATRCRTHDKQAIIACAICNTQICSDCKSLDGCRCMQCFEQASRELTQKTKLQRRLAVGIGFAIALVLITIGFIKHHPFVAQAGGGLAGLMIFLVIYGLFRERKERGTLDVVPLPIDTAALDKPQQVVGQTCEVCEKRISIAKDGHWCTDCQTAIHSACKDSHQCDLEKAGPDWHQMRTRRSL